MKIIVLAGFAESLLLFRSHLLSTIARAGHEVIACAPESSIDIASRLQALGVTYHVIPLKRAGFNPLEDLAYLFRVTRFLQREEPDLLLAYTIKSVIYGSFAARVTGIPAVFSIITGLGYTFGERTFGHRLLTSFVRTLYRLALAKNRAVFFQNPDDRALFLDLGLVRNRNQTVLINGSGVDAAYFFEAGLPVGQPVFLLIARMLRDKGVVEYVEAARLLKRKYPQITFQLVGPFDVNPTSLKPEEVRSWQKEGVIEHRGWVSDVRPVIAAASVFVLPSYREGTPRSVLEAMAMGRPIVTTNAPGCRETVIEGENGFLVPVKDVAALAQAMEHFILQPDLIPKMGCRSRQIAIEKFDVYKVNEVILKTMDLQPGH